MKYTYACKKVPLNDSIKDYAEKRVEKLEKYFHRDDASAFVTFTVEKDKLCTVEITIRDGSTLLRAQTTEPDGDMRGAIDAAVSYIERQILKNKTRLAKRLSPIPTAPNSLLPEQLPKKTVSPIRPKYVRWEMSPTTTALLKWKSIKK